VSRYGSIQLLLAYHVYLKTPASIPDACWIICFVRLLSLQPHAVTRSRRSSQLQIKNYAFPYGVCLEETASAMSVRHRRPV